MASPPTVPQTPLWQDQRRTAADWLAYFQHNHGQLLPLPSEVQITAADYPATFWRSLAMFQLGEYSEGHNLMRATHQWIAKGGDPDLAPAMQWFIREEQRHAADLGRCLKAVDQPSMRSHWLDHTFRHLRRQNLNLETALSVLLNAEIIGFLYAQALQRAIASPLIQTVGRQIEWDESQHLCFQAVWLQQLRQPRSPWRNRLSQWLQHCLLWGTLRAIWPDHRAIFLAAGWSFSTVEQAAIATLQATLLPTNAHQPRQKQRA
ncbi:hypothetical protein [Synechococcus elongatus]|uniref:Ferritin-like domain-containing protein n=1 Tax=Synechococcus elongatus PCC 11802 TaxID=2283154 RepID=A0AAT9JYV4_SYNEL